MGCGAGGDGSGLAAARPACALHPSTCSPEARPAGQAGTAGLYIPGLLSRSGPYWDPGTGPWPPRLACVFFGSRSPGQDINVWMLSSVPRPPPQQDACPDQPPVGGRALGSRGERASAAGLCYLSLPKIPEAGFRAFPSESLKGPERVHRHSQACPGPKPWPAPLCVFPSAVGSQLGPTRPPPCSAELRSGPATTGGPMSREPRGGLLPSISEILS